MDDSFSDLAGKRDYSTPLPMTGRPYQKTYYDWTNYCWRTEVCILLGARESAPGVPWAERPENAGKGKAPSVDRKDLSPQGERHVKRVAAENTRRAAQKLTSVRPDSIRGRIRQFLATVGTATTREICAALPDVSKTTVAAVMSHDPAIEQIGGRRGTGRATEENKARFQLTGGGHDRS